MTRVCSREMTRRRCWLGEECSRGGGGWEGAGAAGGEKVAAARGPDTMSGYEENTKPPL